MKILKNLGSLAFVLLIAGSLQAGGHASSLKWYSDGGVDLITFEDKEVIHLSKEQLGSYFGKGKQPYNCLLYTSPSPRDLSTSRMPSSA